MKFLKQISSVLLSIMFFFTNSSSGSAQDWPDPLLELVSISSDASGYFVDGKIKFDLTINRINGSTYSDITRVWICPKVSWDGFMCNAGQFLVSTTPNSTVSQFVIESPVLTLSDGEYLITGVSFRNGAVITGFTLMYPRTGVVTIGGIATTIGLVNLAAADFKITTPAPEPEPEPVTKPEATIDSVSTTESESTTASTTDPATESSMAESMQSVVAEPATETDNSEPSTEQTNNSHSSTETNSTAEPDPAEAKTAGETESETQPNNSEPTSETEVVTDSTPEETLTEPAETQSATVESDNTQPVVTQTEAAESVVSADLVVAQPSVTSVVIAQNTSEIKTLTPNVAAVITIEAEPKPEPIVTISEITPAVLPADKQQVVMRGAIGGKVLKVSGEAKLTRTIAAGIGSLKLISSNDSMLMVKLGSRVVTQVNLAKDQVISWRSNRPGKLKLILSGEAAELNIDALQLNGKLIANPSFQMRS